MLDLVASQLHAVIHPLHMLGKAAPGGIFTCWKCGGKWKQKVPALGHSWWPRCRRCGEDAWLVTPSEKEMKPKQRAV